MTAIWKELRYLLQTAALPVTGQMRVLADDCSRLQLLAGALSDWRRELPADLAAVLTPDQDRALQRLEEHLAHACRNPDSSPWNEINVRQSERWRHARRLARAALLSFGWRLELPAPEFSFSLLAVDYV